MPTKRKQLFLRHKCMRFLLLLLLTGLFAISSCRKDDIDVQDDVCPAWYYKKLVGEWSLSAEAYEKGYYDSIVVFKAPKLYLSLTDSCVENPGIGGEQYFYGSLYKNDTTVDIIYNSLRVLQRSDSTHQISFYNFKAKWKEYIRGYPDASTSFNDEFFWLKKFDEPFIQDSIKYRIVFSTPPPNVGLMVRYIDSEGEYTIDTLKSGNWQWEKKVFQTTDSKKYHLEIIGATESFYENIPHSYSSECSLIMQTATYPIQYSDGSVIFNRVHPVFHKDLGTVTFSEPEGRRHARMVFENVD